MKSAAAIIAKLKKSEPSSQTHAMLLELLKLSNKLLEMLTKQHTAPAADPHSTHTEMTRNEALDELEKMSTMRKGIDGKREYLLHRATEDFEYEAAAGGNDYATTDDTEWAPEYMSGQNEQEDQNPVVSCWIPEDQIREVPNAVGNTGTWGELGKNPHAAKYKIVVKPGTYTMHQELRQ